MTKSTMPLLIKAKRPPAAFVCGKCLKKCDHGRSIRKVLKSAMLERARATGTRPSKLVETKCMGLCPKQAVVVASGVALARGELLVLKEAGDTEAAGRLLFGTAST